MKKQKLALRQQSALQSTSPTKVTNTSLPTVTDPNSDVKLEKQPEPEKDEEEEPAEQDIEDKEAFSKQLEISNQFSLDFDKYEVSKDDDLNMSKSTKLVKLTEDDWKYL